MNNGMSRKLDNTESFKNSSDNLKNINHTFSHNKNRSFTSVPNNSEEKNNYSNFDSIFESIKNSTLNSENDNNSDINSNYSNNPFSSLDMGTILKLKSIMDKMGNLQNDPRSNLLLSLKPYLKPSRKEKVDQYIKLFSMTQLFDSLNGGEK